MFSPIFPLQSRTKLQWNAGEYFALKSRKAHPCKGLKGGLGETSFSFFLFKHLKTEGECLVDV